MRDDRMECAVGDTLVECGSPPCSWLGTATIDQLEDLLRLGAAELEAGHVATKTALFGLSSRRPVGRTI